MGHAEISKIAVIFPGMGYHSDKPLLYYSKRLALENGYEVVEVHYEFPYKAKEIMNDKVRMKEAVEIAVSQIKEQLSGMKLNEFDDVIFIGKSIGTALAAYFDNELKIGARHIVLTPVPQTFEMLKSKAGIVFHGLNDPWCSTDIAEAKCRELELKLCKIEDANHSLETGSALTDIANLREIMEKLEHYAFRKS